LVIPSAFVIPHFARCRPLIYSRASRADAHMTPAQLQTIKQIFNKALDCEPDKVNEFLEGACQGDEALPMKLTRS
jgi:hypothetical protein